MATPRRRTNNQWVYASTSTIHGRGLFARTDIAPGVDLVEYAGPRISVNEGRALADAENVYIFAANRRESIDGSVAWNLARHANHSCDPNAKTVKKGSEIWLQSLQQILKGEEITYDYGYSFRDDPTVCRCGAASCEGFIVSAKHR